MDDIPFAAAEHDIQLYLSNKLAGVSADLKATDINMLAQKCDGLFEWARLASAHIKNTTIVGNPIRRLRSWSLRHLEKEFIYWMICINTY
jgi:hypothetical protein